MRLAPETIDARLRRALETTGHRYTEQRAAVYRFLSGTTTHPNADEVFQAVRVQVPGISLATVYKSLETLVNCGLASKLTYGDGSARYDGRTDPHHHARCIGCGRVTDAPGELSPRELAALSEGLDGFDPVGYRLELTGYCHRCHPLEELRSQGWSGR
jgi:Fur family transcriptional regulator, peroxide stress response regulator